MADDELVMIEYAHPSRGSHAVYGGGNPRRSYGYRKQGDRFLVQRVDLRLYPHWFKPLMMAEPPPTEEVAPPPPEPLFDLGKTIYPEVVTPVSDVLPIPADVTRPATSAQERIIQKARLDLQALPGVTPAVANAMRRAGIRTAEDILNMGVEGLLNIQWIGPQKAPMIYQHVQDRYGNKTPASPEPGHLATGQDAVQP